MNISEKKDAIQQVIVDAKALLKSLQEECPHESGSYAYGSNTGNWCPSDDSYWRNHHCSDCDGQWREWSEDNYGVKNPEYSRDLGSLWKEVR